MRLIQPNVAQGASFAPENKEKILSRYFALSDRATGRDRGGVARRDPSDLAGIGVSLHSLPRRAGAGRNHRFFARRSDPDHRRRPVEDFDRRQPRYFNSIEIVDRDGLSRERYDKQHLVPFGEYMPFESVLRSAGVTQFVDIPGGFTAGSGRRVLRVPGLPRRDAPHLLRGDLSDRGRGHVLEGASGRNGC